MRKKWRYILIIVLIGGVLMFFFTNRGDKIQPLATGQFIEKWLQNENGTLATYIKDSDAKMKI